MHERSAVIPLDPSNRRARREVDNLIGQAIDNLTAARAGNLGQVHQAYGDVIAAVRVIMKHGLDAEALAS